MNNPFKDLKLTKEEREITDAIDRGQIKEVTKLKREKRRYRQIAQSTLAKTKNINLRLSTRALYKLKTKAAASGIPYQTLAASVLHRFASE